VLPGTEVQFTLEGSRIIITPVSSPIKDDRREALRRAAAHARATMSLPFRSMSADEIVEFLRGDEPLAAPRRARRGSR
jgi:virulence-associated protein VagC